MAPVLLILVSIAHHTALALGDTAVESGKEGNQLRSRNSNVFINFCTDFASCILQQDCSSCLQSVLLPLHCCKHDREQQKLLFTIYSLNFTIYWDSAPARPPCSAGGRQAGAVAAPERTPLTVNTLKIFCENIVDLLQPGRPPPH